LTLSGPPPKKLTEIQTAQQLAHLLNVDYQKFIYHVWRVPSDKRYVEFSIPKRTGGSRVISVPATHLKTIQSNLRVLLDEIYLAQKPVHGFYKGRSILTNATPHVRRNLLLNVDLQDFFGTIHFGRIRGMLMAWPYKLSDAIATVIAQICCHENKLPQGAPTSPVIANMLSAKMDSDLRRLASLHRLKYTRYADDLTFSTNKPAFSPDIVKFKLDEHGIETTILGDALREVIEIQNGFVVNPEKIHVRTRRDRQDVTGLVVNKKLNVDRRFVRKTRAMLHSWQRDGIAEATAHHYTKNPSHHVPPFKDPPTIEAICYGRIGFIRSVVGQASSVYMGLARRYNALKPTECPLLPVMADAFITKMKNNVFLLQNNPKLTDSTFTGTAFYLEDVKGFVTCDHVLQKNKTIDNHDIYWLVDPDEPTKNFALTVRNKVGYPVDLAILDLQDSTLSPITKPGFLPLKSLKPYTPPNSLDKITVVGVPNANLGQSLSIKSGAVNSSISVIEGQIDSQAVKSSIKRFNVSAPIIQGNSGGPVLDGNGFVLGIAVSGNNDGNKTDLTEFHSFIPVDALFKYVEKSATKAP